jgi:Uma2 family endonuclease
MAVIAKATNRISLEEYLEGEKYGKIRHEYIDGAVFAMAGTSDDHNRIAGNLFGELRHRLRGKRCEPFMVDMRVKMPPAFGNVYYYPDVIVCCEPADNAKYFRERPRLIFEVLSAETERTDRGEKALAYRQIPGIGAYILLEQDRMAATVFRPGQSGWSEESLEGRGAILKLPEIDFEIALAEIYDRTAAATR